MSKPLKAAIGTFRSFPFAIRWSLYAVGAYLSYAALLGLLVPYLAKQHIPQQVSSLIERPVTLTDVTINPFTLQLTIDHFAVLEGTEPFIQFEQANVQMNFWQSIWNRAVSLEYVMLEKPTVYVQRLADPNAGAFNFSDIIEAIARNTVSNQAPETSEDDKGDRQAPLFPVQIKHVKLNQGELRFLDALTATELRYPDIHFSLDKLSTQAALTDEEKSNQYTLHIRDADSATLEMKGQLQLKPLEVVGDLNVQKIQLSRLWGFVAQDISAKLTAGEVNLASHYHIAQTLGQTEADDTMSVTTTQGGVAIHRLNFNANGQSVLSLPTFAVNDIATNVEKRTVDIASVTSQGLKVSTKISHQGVDLVSLFSPKSPTQEPNKAASTNKAGTAAETPPPAWLVTLNGVDMKNYQLNVEERLVTEHANQWQIAPINFTTKRIVSDLSKPIEFVLATSVNGKGSMTLSGVADAKHNQVAADLDVTSLKLAQFQPYLATMVNAMLTDGEISTQASLQANSEGTVVVTGAAHIDQLSIQDNQLKKPFVKWRSLAVDQFNFDLQNATLAIDTLSLDQPYARVVINQDRSTNIGDLVMAQPTGDASLKQGEANPTEKPFALSINKIAFNDGSAFFADNSLTPNFASGIEQLEGKVEHISSVPGTKATVGVSGKIDRYAPVKVSGSINPLLDQPYLDLDVMFKSVELTTVNPYSGTYAGRYIDKGQLSLALNYQLENNKLKGANHVVINQLQLGKASDSKQATSLPLDLAIALLQDRNGVIDLGIEVSGDVNDPEFGLGAVIWHAVSNIITKAVTAPFSMIANVVGSNEELDSIAFDYGNTDLTKDEQEKLHTLGRALASRPKLTLSIVGSVNAAEDSKAIALHKFNQQLAKQANIAIDGLPADLTASTMPVSGALSEALQALYQQAYNQSAKVIRETIEDEAKQQNAEITQDELIQRWHIALYNFVLNQQNVTDAELGMLAQRRAQTVKAYLVDDVSIDPARVFLRDSRFELEQNDSAAMLALDAK